tara:strand:+ start:509 stop:871 length:363 start_codon:yes stop_codon:yes gene_type:complete
MRIAPRNIDDEYEKSREPYWPIMCGHGAYQFSFALVESGRNVSAKPGFETTDLIDVYCYEKCGKQEFRLRFNEKEDGYFAAVGIEDLISWSGEEPYRTALVLLIEDGCLSFTPRYTEEDE